MIAVREAASAVQFIVIIALAAALGGCAAIEQARKDHRQRDRDVAHRACAKAGLGDDERLFARCVELELTLIAEQRRRALEQASPAFYGQPYTPGLRICVPGAAGPGVTC